MRLRLFPLVAVVVLLLNIPQTRAARVLLTWDFEHCVRDVAEYQTELGGEWHDIPGPYEVSADGKSNMVIIPVEEKAMFFRVRRWWGEPWVYFDDLPEETPENTVNCRIPH